MRWIAAAVLGVAVIAGGALILARRKPLPAVDPLQGYASDIATVQAEYRKFHGRLLRDPEVERQFGIAGAFALKQQYTQAIDILEGVANQAAVPVIFHDLGMLYAASGDRARAILAFREALARDADYRPVRDAIDRLTWLGRADADPLRREIEPNNSSVTANLIGLGAPVQAELTAGDTDTFKFITPPAPRDIVELEIVNSGGIEFGIRISAETAKEETANLNATPGESIKRYVSQAPNTALYLSVWGAHNTTGAYQVSLRPLKAFDAYEPNDDIFSPSHIQPGTGIDANIMDSQDTDFYVFQAPRTGTVTVEIENQSKTLIPALTTFGPDRRNSGFGPDVHTPGGNLRHTMEVQEHETYYLQVWSQALSFGKYRLTIQ